MKSLASWVLTFVAFALFCANNCNNSDGEKADKPTDIMANTPSITAKKAGVTVIQLRDSLAVKQAEIEKLQVTNRSLQSLYGDLLKSTKTRPKDIKELTSVGTQTSGTDTVMCRIDSFNGLEARWRDDYIDILVNIDSARKAVVDYNIRDSLTVISYQKKHSILFGLIKWKSYEGCKVITHNPKSTPVTVISYTNVKH